MYRLAQLVLLITIALGLVSCANNDKKISSWEVNDVYQSTTVTPNLTSGGKTYLGPSINTMDEFNTYAMFNIRTVETQQGVKTYELQVQLTYFNQVRDYNSATLINGPVTTFKVISKESGLCESRGCMFKELLSINVTDAFLKQNIKNGFQLKIGSKVGVTTVVYIPPQYIQGYLKAVDGIAY